MFLFIVFLIFTGALAAAGYYAWSIPRQHAEDMLAARLRELRVAGGGQSRTSGDLVRQERRGQLAGLGDFVSWLGVLRRLQDSIDQADLKYRAAEVFALCVILGLVSYVLLWLTGVNILVLRAGFALALAAVPVIYVLAVRRKRLNRFEAALPDSIDLFNRSMKAGHNIHAGLETMAQETLDPVRMEFRKVVEELALGAPVDQTLHGLGRRVPLIDVKFFVTGLILQRQTGANMVQVLENLAQLVRERLNLAAKLKASTAQQRFSAGLLCSLPIFFAFGLWIAKPDYLRLLYTDPTGQLFLTYAIISEIVGILVIRKLANPKF
jgi:tight adherence protein B